MKLKIYILLFFTTSQIIHSQSDTLFVNNERIAVNVKEVTTDAVKFTYPGEEMINSMFKNGVNKIVFKSGRTQLFNESSSYKTIN